MNRMLGVVGERTLIGVSIAGRAARASAVLGRVRGEGYEARLDVLESAACPVPRQYSEMFERLDRGDDGVAPAVALTTGLTQLAATLVQQLGSPDELAEVLAVGVTDPGLWLWSDDGGPSGYLSLCDGAQLAEATGLTVVDAFPARDVALGGHGGPLDALPLWMLLHDAKKPRVFIDLGRSTRMVYLPASYEGSGSARVLGLEIAPGVELLNRFAHQLTGGRQTCDVGGKLAVQGRVVPEVIEHFSRAPCLADDAPRWRPRGVPLEWFFDETLRRAVDAGWSVGDLLASATRFIALSVEQAVTRRAPKLPPLEQIVLAGGGQLNELLVREIGARLSDLEMLSVADLGVESPLVDAASAALLALLHAEQLPATTTLLTGTVAPRVLGRLTPGTPQAWRRFLNHLAANQPNRMPLSRAL